MRISDWSSDVGSSDLNAASALCGRLRRMWRTAIEAEHQGCLLGSARFGAVRVAGSCLVGGAVGKLLAWLADRRWISSRNLPRSSCILSCSARRTSRSEEPTSELQSLMRISYAVFCLKKKKP